MPVDDGNALTLVLVIVVTMFFNQIPLGTSSSRDRDDGKRSEEGLVPSNAGAEPFNCSLLREDQATKSWKSPSTLYPCHINGQEIEAVPEST